MKYIAVFLAALFAAGTAYAADLPGSTKDELGRIDQVQTVNWTGAYVGGQVGWTNAGHTVSLDGPGGTLVELDGIASSGLIGGGRVGIDFARGRFLVGAFADYNFSDASTDLEIGGTNLLSVEKEDEWTAGIRAGMIVAPRTLVYGLVGYTQTTYSFNVPGGGIDVDYDGVTAGAGVEFAVANGVFLGLEGSHTFYDEETVLPLGGGFAIKDELDETRVMGTLKVKLGLGGL
jgi:outer membrane immunogenic protein